MPVEALREVDWRQWPLTLTCKQAADLIGVEYRTVLRMVENGDLTGLDFGSVRQRRVTRQSVVDAIKLT